MKINKKRKQNIFQKRRLAKALMVFVMVLIFLVSHPVFAANQNQNFLTQAADIGGSVIGAAANILTSPFVWGLNLLLLAAFMVASIILFFAGMLMDWAINPNNFLIIVNSQAVIDGWKIVRDFLNIAFILVLLYSAFCTIFQVEKYHLKKILLMVVLMALLVNFSFPVARFIIDSSNVLMYYILNTAFPNLGHDGLSGNIITNTKIVKMVMPAPNAKEILIPLRFAVRAMLATIFMFLLAITVLIFGALLVIRIVVLAILIIFAPIGFVGAIFPSTKEYADKWWGHLFKQSFFGPIMIFMLYLALTLMNEMNNKNLEASIKKQVENNSIPGSYSDIVVAGTYTAIPVVILWIGFISAQQIGAMGSKSIMSGGRRLANWVRKQPWTRKQMGRIIRVTGDTTQKILGKIPGYGAVSRATFGRMGDAGARMEAQAEMDMIKRGRSREDYERAVISEIRKGWKNNGGATPLQIQTGLYDKDPRLNKAAAMEAAENGFADLKQYRRAAAIVASDPALKKEFENKVREKYISFVIDDEIDKEATRSGRSVSDVKADAPFMKKLFKDKVGKMNAEQLSKQEKLLTRNDFNKYFLSEKVNKAVGPPTGKDHKFFEEIAKRATPMVRDNWRARGYSL